MSVIRAIKRENYTIISNIALNDDRLSLKARGLYAYVMSKPNTWRISIRGLEAQLQEGKNAIAAALKELEDAGYIEREIIRGESGQFIRREMHLHEEPRPGFRDEDEPRPGFRPLDNRTQVINNKVITEEDLDTTYQGDKPQTRKDHRDPEVTQLVEAFEHRMSLKMPRSVFQRRAAKTLISRVGLEVALRAVEAVARARDQQFAPRILSLEDLRDKWNHLEDYYRRENTSNTVVAE